MGVEGLRQGLKKRHGAPTGQNKGLQGRLGLALDTRDKSARREPRLQLSKLQKARERIIERWASLMIEHVHGLFGSRQNRQTSICALKSRVFAFLLLLDGRQGCRDLRAVPNAREPMRRRAPVIRRQFGAVFKQNLEAFALQAQNGNARQRLAQGAGLVGVRSLFEQNAQKVRLIARNSDQSQAMGLRLSVQENFQPFRRSCQNSALGKLAQRERGPFVVASGQAALELGDLFAQKGAGAAVQSAKRVHRLHERIAQFLRVRVDLRPSQSAFDRLLQTDFARSLGGFDDISG